MYIKSLPFQFTQLHTHVHNTPLDTVTIATSIFLAKGLSFLLFNIERTLVIMRCVGVLKLISRLTSTGMTANK